MPGWIKWTLIAILVAAAIVAAAITLAPRLLDRVYYTGPASAHFDGQRFFNPEDRRPGAPPPQGFSAWRFLRFAVGMDRAPWPDRVPVSPGRPPARVEGDAMRVTWIGHSTVLVQTRGLAILTDPIWSDRASPLAFLGPKRVRAPAVRFDDLPRIDAVLLSHNHYDHMDVATLKRLWARDRPKIVVPLGTDAILTGAGVPSIARDWGGRVTLAPGIDVVLERAHHWTSRRGADRNRALWTGFSVTLPGGNLFYSGDTGMGGGGWLRDAARDGPYRLALIPIGAYAPRAMMAPSHVDPDEAATIFRTLGAAYGLGVHWGTFRLSAEAIDDPPRAVAAALARDGVPPGHFRTLEPGVGWDVPAR